MKTMLTLNRIEDGRVLETRRQYSRSFTRKLMEILYTQYTQIQSGAPWTATDILGQARAIDAQVTNYEQTHKSNLRMEAPSGNASILIPPGVGCTPNGGAGLAAVYHPHHFVPGSLLGIVVGGDNTPAAPADFALLQRIFHGKGGVAAGPATFDTVAIGDDSSYEIYGASIWFGFMFLAQRGFRMSSFKLLLYREGSPGTVTAYLGGVKPTGSGGTFGLYPESTAIDSVSTDGNTLPTAAPYEWREFTLASPRDINPGIWHAILLKVPSGNSSNSVRWRYQTSSPHIARYVAIYTTNGGTSYSLGTITPMFELIGSSLGEMEYSGCEVMVPIIANPNGQFSLRRLFSNNCGNAISVKEAGIYASGCQYNAYGSSFTFVGAPYSFCVARDVIAPAINVPDGQVLQVTYTPQITV